jgi:hypothetical protein
MEEALNGTGARAQALLDAVRARVGLASVPVSYRQLKTKEEENLQVKDIDFLIL